MLHAPPIDFRCSSEQLAADSYVLRLTGELDLHTAPQLENELESLLRAGATHILVDMSEVDFLDSSGLGVLLAAGARLGRSGLTLSGLGLEPRRVLELTGADRVVSITPAA